MPDTNDNSVQLDTLSATFIRENNDQVDEAISGLEDQVASLQDERASLKATIEDKDDRIDALTEEKETAEQLLETFRESQRDDHLSRIRAANDQLSESDQVDLASLEDASPDQLATVADFAEKLAGQASQSGVANQSEPDLSSVEGDGDLDAQLKQAAADIGMADAFEKARSGGFERAEGLSFNAAAESASATGGVSNDDLAQLLGDGGER